MDDPISKGAVSALLEAFLVHAPIGLAFFDRDYRYLRINGRLSEINGVPVEAHLGKTVREVLPINADAVEPMIDEVFATGRAHPAVGITGQTPLLPGEIRHWLTGFFPVFGENETVEQVGCFVLEITGSRRGAENARERERELDDRSIRLKVALAAGKLGDWSWDAGTDFVTLSPLAAEIFGLPAGTSVTWTEMHTLLHVDDRERMRRAVEDSIRESNYYDVEYRVLRTNGSVVWAAAHGLAQHDSNGDVIGMIGTLQDITDRKETQLERDCLLESERAARQELERLNRLKDEFLATLSHELRTPLNAILGWTQLLKKKAQGLPPELMKGLDVIEKNSRGQAQLIEDLLDMSRIVSGKIRLEVREVDLANIVQSALASIQPSADAKQVKVVPLLETVPPYVGDPNRLQQIVWNLLSNAVKFTPDGGRIDVTLLVSGERVEISVKDSGKGISADFLPYVFDRFRQADSSSTRKYSGLGIGLSIVKQLAELHGGTVRAESAGDEMGATFSVTLPMVIPAGKDSAGTGATPASTEIDSKCFHEADLRGIRILVVDDEADSREVAKRMLEEWHATISTASSVDEAVELVRTGPYDLLISDIGMPDRDGYELMRVIRELFPEKPLPAIALTAFARSEDRKRALDAGYAEFVKKPIEPRELLGRVAMLTGRGGTGTGQKGSAQ